MFINISCICMSPYKFGLYHVDYSTPPLQVAWPYSTPFQYKYCGFDSLYGFQLYWLSTGLSTREVPRFQRVYTVPKLTQVTLSNWCNCNIKRAVSIAMVYVLQVNTSSLCSLLSKDTKQFDSRDNFFEFLCFF